MLNSNGRIKLCDFGLSTASESDFFGTTAYMSPEKLSGISNHSEKSKLTPYLEQQGDIWSLGMTLLELACGIYPMPVPPEEEFLKLFKADPFGELSRFQSIHKINLYYDTNLFKLNLIILFKIDHVQVT